MNCCAIKLANRTEERAISHKDEHRCLLLLLENDDNHRPSSSNEDLCDQQSEQPCLSVLNIMLPKNVKSFNTGSSTQRWANKRPRLKSAKLIQEKEPKLVDMESINVPILIEELDNDIKEEVPEEIDPDIQKLLEETHVQDGHECRMSCDDTSERAHKLKRKHRKKSKKDKEKKSKHKVKKTVSFSLSKPPTPQTEQIIRVDVVSNYSVEFETCESNRSDCVPSTPEKLSDEKHYHDTSAQFMYQLYCAQKLNETKNFYLESKKAVLFPRLNEK
ncbi:hypothetical protein PPYR_08775 [Photinus pyralis]|uniref:Uncharacterized protein n=1 Tax=Photinus pyralis TaxID=7054 RepID=A0A5N4AK97_PHOPY|nr:uncharacterized protein LOC116172040 [Photinus pyralis]KAB0797782.1 hypothetical protein PPYR_08775 [Photinus pyralis]